MSKTHGAYVVSWDFSHGNDVGILLVGSNESGKMDIVNAFQGEEALDIYKKLSGIKKETVNEVQD